MTPLEIIIKGNASGANTELQKTQAELAKTATAAVKADSSLQKFSKSSGQSIFNLTEKLRQLQSAVFTEKDLSKVAAFNQQIKQTETEIAKMNALGTSSGGLASLGPQFAKIGTDATKAFSAVRQLAYILPGVGIAGILAFATDPIINYVSALFGASEAEKKIQDARLDRMKQYNAAVQSAIKDVAKEGAEVIGLIGILKSETETRDRKLSAIKELQKIQPDVFKNIKLEGDAVTGLDLAYQAYLARLQNVIQAKILQAQLEERIARQLELQRILGDVTKANTVQIKDFSAKSLEAARAQKELADQIFNTRKIFGEGITGAQAVRELDRVTNDIDALGKKLFALSNYISVPELKIKPEKIKIVKPTGDPRKYIISDKGLFSEQGLKFDAKIVVNLQPLFKYDAAGIDKQAYENAERISAIIANSVNSAISNLADNFANVLTGQQNAFSGLFDGLAKTLAGGLKEIGKYLVQTYLLIGVIQKIKFSNPAVGVAVGFALQVLGALIQSKVASTKAFASGVRNFEGGIATVGERGPETVFLPRGASVQPNNEVSAYGGGSQVFIPAITLRGADLVIAFNRASAQMNRNN